MKDFWKELIHTITTFLIRALDEHPGKLIGTLLGFVLGLLVVLLGLWKTLVLFAFVILGFILGKKQDDHKKIFDWLNRFFD